MARETLLMMSNDERLTSVEVSRALKYLLAQKTRKEISRKPYKDPRFSRRMRPPTLDQRSHSPELSYSMLSPTLPEPLTPSLTSSTGDLGYFGDRITRDRAATQSDIGHVPMMSRSICQSYLDTPYEYEIIQTAFHLLYTRLRGTDGVRVNADGYHEIHINNVKQFLLECYVNSQVSLSAALSPFKTAKWVDVRSFVASMESIQQVSYDHSFFNKEELATTKNNLIRQKLLCTFHSVFFKLVDYNQRNALSKFEVKTVSGMALRSKKKVNSENLDMVVQKAFEKADEIRGFVSETLTFEEFYCVLKG